MLRLQCSRSIHVYKYKVQTDTQNIIYFYAIKFTLRVYPLYLSLSVSTKYTYNEIVAKKQLLFHVLDAMWIKLDVRDFSLNFICSFYFVYPASCIQVMRNIVISHILCYYCNYGKWKIQFNWLYTHLKFTRASIVSHKLSW